MELYLEILLLISLSMNMYGVKSKVEKYKFDINCLTLKCKSDGKVCGIRPEGEGFRLRLFTDECALLNYKCAVKDNYGYEVTDLNYCIQAFQPEPDNQPSIHDPCEEYDCFHPVDDVPVCGLTQDGHGFRVRIFKNKCSLWEHSCDNNVNFTLTEFYICKGLELPDTDKPDTTNTNDTDTKGMIRNSEDKDFRASGDEETARNDDPGQNVEKLNKRFDDDFYIASNEHYYFRNETNPVSNITDANYPKTNEAINNTRKSYAPGFEDTEQFQPVSNFAQETARDKSNQTENIPDIKKLIVVRGLQNSWRSVNETINRFFAATHVYDVPIKEMPADYLNETTRRGLIKIAGPIKVYIPAFEFPKALPEGPEYEPTLNSCFHKCPTKCPATYAPVCAVPGRIAREPSLMFLNHCFMDVAQCKQYREDKSPTSLSSAYQEASFVFCLGDAMNHMYHFLPLVKTLQHMGRLPKKGRFHYRFTNLKFFNNFLKVKNPNLMG